MTIFGSSIFIGLEESLFLGVLALGFVVIVLCLRLVFSPQGNGPDYLKEVSEHIQLAKLSGENQVCEKEIIRLSSLTGSLNTQFQRIADALPPLLQFSVRLSWTNLSRHSSPLRSPQKVLFPRRSPVKIVVELHSDDKTSFRLGTTKALPMAESMAFDSIFTVDPLGLDSPRTVDDSVSHAGLGSSLVFRVHDQSKLLGVCRIGVHMLLAQSSMTQEITNQLRITSETEDTQPGTLSIRVQPTEASPSRNSATMTALPSDYRNADLQKLERAWNHVMSQLKITDPVLLAFRCLTAQFQHLVQGRAGLSKRISRMKKQESALQMALEEALQANAIAAERQRNLAKQCTQVLKQKNEALAKVAALQEIKEQQENEMRELLAYRHELTTQVRQFKQMLADRQLGKTPDRVKRIEIQVSCSGLDLTHSAIVRVQILNGADQVQDTQRTEPIADNNPEFGKHLFVSYSTSVTNMSLLFTISDCDFPEPSMETFVAAAQADMKGFNTAPTMEQVDRKRREALEMQEIPSDATIITQIKVPLFRLVPSEEDAIIKAVYPLAPVQGSICLMVKVPDNERVDGGSNVFTSAVEAGELQNDGGDDE